MEKGYNVMPELYDNELLPDETVISERMTQEQKMRCKANVFDRISRENRENAKRHRLPLRKGLVLAATLVLLLAFTAVAAATGMLDYFVKGKNQTAIAKQGTAEAAAYEEYLDYMDSPSGREISWKEEKQKIEQICKKYGLTMIYDTYGEAEDKGEGFESASADFEAVLKQVGMKNFLGKYNRWPKSDYSNAWQMGGNAVTISNAYSREHCFEDLQVSVIRPGYFSDRALSYGGSERNVSDRWTYTGKDGIVFSMEESFYELSRGPESVQRGYGYCAVGFVQGNTVIVSYSRDRNDTERTSIRLSHREVEEILDGFEFNQLK